MAKGINNLYCNNTALYAPGYKKGEFMKNTLIMLLAMAIVSFATPKTANDMTLERYMKVYGKVPGKCISKGATHKCAIDGFFPEGAIINAKQKYIYYLTESPSSEILSEYSCKDIFVRVGSNGNAYILHDNEYCFIRFYAKCDLDYRNLVLIKEYDELGILKNRVEYDHGNTDYCRDRFHFQFGNDDRKPFTKSNPREK